jgi:L-aspartate oxidase
MTTLFQCDVLVIGSGAAGLSLALQLPESLRIAVLSKGLLDEGSTRYAQGGIAAVLDSTDSIEAHVEDTLVAGAGLCHKNVVRFVVERGRQSIQWLVEQGVDFTRAEDREDVFQLNQLHLTQEGGHSHRRVIHSADATGKAVSDSLINQVQRKKNIALFTQRVAINLTWEVDTQTRKRRCTGAYVLDQQSGQVEVYSARFVALATGGASKVYLYTSNPDGASGDGIAMAWRAGCRVADLEFNQFHPTCLYHPQAKSFLVTEALRGEGARLLLPNGQAFMQRYDARAELAPRDIVARAIDHEMKHLGIDHVYLDISHKPADFIKNHFPTVYERCLQFGIDITKQPIPVVPAAHYTCGGIMVDRHGHTDLQNLYAIGETSFTGLHGANRMASNSLLECFVFAHAAAGHITAQLSHVQQPAQAPQWDESRVTPQEEGVMISHNWDELRRVMWDYVGIVRTNKRLERARLRIEQLQREIREQYTHYKVSSDLLELRNLATVAELMVRCAQSRKESRGLHYTLDYPHLLPQARDTILIPENFAGLDVIVG